MKKLAKIVTALSMMLPAVAQAKPGFPGQIQQHLQLPGAPSCLICHGSKAGGGPVSQPFGQAMLTAGLTLSGGSSLTTALDKLAADGTDSNGDGTSDIAGLKAGIEPLADKPPVVYGCGGGRIAPPGPLGWPASILAIVTFFFLSSSLRASGRERDFTQTKETNRASRV